MTQSSPPPAPSTPPSPPASSASIPTAPVNPHAPLIAIIASVLVAAMIVGGVMVAGSPQTARNEEADRMRVDRLRSLHHRLEEHYVRNGRLPASLREPIANMETNEELTLDPETKRPFEYRVRSERTYEICAVFKTDSRKARESFPADPALTYDHRPGRNCFTKTMTRSPRDPFGPIDRLLPPG